MKTLPMLFSAPMVKALLAGRKTQTRRLSFRGQPGDLIWAKETWSVSEKHDALRPIDIPERSCTVIYHAGGSASNDTDEAGVPFWDTGADWPREDERPRWMGKTRVSIHMPAWASRIPLRVSEVRSEPLQWISDEDAIAEGLTNALGVWGVDGVPGIEHESPRLVYGGLWSRLHGAESWEANPDVSVISFEMIRSNFRDLEKAAA